MKRIRRFFVAMVALVALLVVLLAVLFGMLGSATQPVVDAADKFMIAVQLGDFPAAHNLLTPTRQAGFSVAAFMQTVPPGTLTEWRLPNQSISTALNQGSQGNVSGTAVFGGTSYRVSFTLNQVDGAWRIATYTFTPG